MKEAELIQKLNELSALPAETEVVEFKEAKNDFHFEKIGKYFSALSNEANLKGKKDAWLIFGIENKHKSIVGSNYRHTNRASLDSLKAEIAQKTTDAISFIEIHEIQLPEGRVVMFQIPAAPKGLPVAWGGHYYGRNGEELSPLNLEKIDRIRRQVTYEDWSAVIVPAASINDLDPLAIAKAKENYKIKNPRIAAEIDGWNTITFLSKTHLLIHSKLTRTAIILLGKPESVAHISPVHPQISWVLYTKDKIEKDYHHFEPPYIMALDEVFTKIRNLKYRYLKDGTLFPEEVDQYDPQNIKEALSNCIAHMDYTLGGRITVAENEDAYISFANPGSFLPGSVEEIIRSEDPPTFYRNTLLVKTMESFNMIDSIGSGIKRMYRVQRQRFFPMPDYELSSNKVKLTLIGKVLDMDYARALVRNPDLDLEEIIMLDKVQKRMLLTDDEIKHLKQNGLIEGKKPHWIISATLAQATGQKADYTRQKAFTKQEYFDWIMKGIRDHGFLNRKDIEDLIWNRLSDLLTEKQKKTKVGNIIYELSRNGIIYNAGSDTASKWMLRDKERI